MNRFYIHAIAITGPGLADWQSSVPVLRGETDYIYAEPAKFSATILPPNERRRTTSLIKLALQTAEQAMAEYAGLAQGKSDAAVIDDSAIMQTTKPTLNPAEVASVFASSDGDAEIIDKICSALTLPDRPVSPTQFHNSVHNAPAGYWAIATHSHLPSSSISAGHYSFAAGLSEAACYTLATDKPILLVAYDQPAPFPLTPLTGVTQPFAVALLLSSQLMSSPQNNSNVCQCQFELTEVAQDSCTNSALESLRLSNPAARSLPLLERIAAGEWGGVHLPHSDELCLRLEVSPC